MATILHYEALIVLMPMIGSTPASLPQLIQFASPSFRYHCLVAVTRYLLQSCEAMSMRRHHYIGLQGLTENAGPENGGPK